MLETVVDVLSAVLLAAGGGGVLIAIGVLISDRRRYIGASRSKQPADEDQKRQR